ncbi:uncharacterized protein [Ptychodera flava]|uniref:uncharacterized protein n=1 Tax=Ptychodera flava TaxID=63121 RepID=UPI00396A6906
MSVMKTEAADDVLKFVPRDDFERLIDTLKSQSPHSLKVIDVIWSNIISEEWKTKVYVNQWPNPGVVVCMNGHFNGPHTPVGDFDVFIHSTSLSVLKDVLKNTKVFNWSKTMLFVGVDNGVQSVLEEIVPKSASLKFDVFSEVDLYIHTDSSKLLCSVQEGLSLRSLHEKDAETVLKHWKYGRDWLLPEFKHTIRNNSTSGLYTKNGELVSWAVHNFFGGIGFVHTLEKYRGLGCAKAVIADATKKIMNCGIHPWAHVENVPGRERSERMLEAVGYTKSGISQKMGLYAPAGKEITY